ncbi:methyltransferase family protein [Micromonospora endophytica]|uniref:Isoprenylcysteine carboxyl methyltransferase n=1 Tax=Micromonospora endophytica TaxID=515350 RepID=A0A2W2DH83_9ACTN|nr:isoprenylcysteine carboxylmethyltransferase family protein [Micromonospora endophytica]PZG00120.1 isoprenylcysteine carboxyl methyltransferase [Micromonospora endophytica]RIW42253.1 isoprenylcysteine carboxylmethyltransferase family protein [Micromonospora endophytica]
MAGFALALYLTALAAAFGWRSFAQWRRTGDTGLRLDAGRPGTLRWWAKLLFVAALLLNAAGPVAGLAGLAPVGLLDRGGVRLAGTVLALAGVAAVLAAQRQMGTSWRIGVDPAERTSLVTHGAFAVARNPIFTAMAVTSIGLAAMVPNAVSLVAAGTLVAALQLQVRAVEEPYLARVHGEAWNAYASRVGRFLPRLGRQLRQNA